LVHERRRGEILSLRWGQIDWEENLITESSSGKTWISNNLYDCGDSAPAMEGTREAES
jgi:integrase